MSRILEYRKTLTDKYKNTILKLDYRNFGHWKPRKDTKNSIKEWYNISRIESKNINLISKKGSNIFDLHENSRISIIKGNVFFNLYIVTNQVIPLSHQVSFALYYGEKQIIRLTNYGNSLFLQNRRKSCNGYYPIKLFECFEKGFIDINNFNDDKLEIRIEGIDPGTYQLVADYAYLKYSRVINENICEYIFTEDEYSYNNEKGIIDISKNIVALGIYLRYWNRDVGKVNVLNMKVKIDKIISWDYSSSRIMSDNDNNYHNIWFFPDSDDDFLKSNKIFGLNLGSINNINISINTDKVVNDINGGIFYYNIIEYGNGNRDKNKKSKLLF